MFALWSTVTTVEAAVVSVAAVHVDPAVEAEEEAAEEEAK